jgi:hypothetical protein
MADCVVTARVGRGGCVDHSGLGAARTGDVSRQAFRRRVSEGMGSSGNRPTIRVSVGAGKLSRGGATRGLDNRSRASIRARSDVDDAEGSGEPRAGQIALSYDPDERIAVQRVMDQIRWFRVAGGSTPSSPFPRRSTRRRSRSARRTSPRRCHVAPACSGTPWHPGVRGCRVDPHCAGADRRGLPRGVYFVGGDGASWEVRYTRCRIGRVGKWRLFGSDHQRMARKRDNDALRWVSALLDVRPPANRRTPRSPSSASIRSAPRRCAAKPQTPRPRRRPERSRQHCQRGPGTPRRCPAPAPAPSPVVRHSWRLGRWWPQRRRGTGRSAGNIEDRIAV